MWFRLGRLFSLGLSVPTCGTCGDLRGSFLSTPTPASGSVEAGIPQHSCATSLEVCVRHLVVETDSAVHWLSETQGLRQLLFIYEKISPGTGGPIHGKSALLLEEIEDELDMEQ